MTDPNTKAPEQKKPGPTIWVCIGLARIPVSNIFAEEPPKECFSNHEWVQYEPADLLTAERERADQAWKVARLLAKAWEDYKCSLPLTVKRDSALQALETQYRRILDEGE